jgi:hypothetical protein
MRKIERPDSTTIVLDFPFHLVKNEAELKNILVDVDVEKQVKSLGMYMDPVSFTPHFVMWVDKGKPLMESIKFIVSAERYKDAIQHIDHKKDVA